MDQREDVVVLADTLMSQVEAMLVVFEQSIANHLGLILESRLETT
jgi:hypothetical protein